MVRTLSERVKRKIRPAVISFLLMTESMPISSASEMYSRFSTSAMVLETPIFLAATQASTLVSELEVTAIKASQVRTSSS